MAARRLAISSLLCADESDVPVAGPSHSPPTISSPQIVFGPYSHGGRSQRTADHQNITPEVNLLPTVHDVVPLSLQSAPFRLRRYTPSPSAHPDFNASGLPASRKSFKEIAFDDYHDQPGSHAAPSATSPAVDTFDYTTRLLDTTRYSSSPATANVYLQRRTHQRGSLSPSDCSFSTQLYNPSSHRAYIDQPSPPCTSRSQSTHYVSSPSRSPAVPYATSHPQSPLLSATSSTFYSQPYPPHHNAYRPSLSPLLSAHKGAATTLRPAFVSNIEMRNTTRHTSPSPSPPQPTPLEQFAPTHTRPTLSDLLTYSPPLSRASAASLPHILNSPIMQRGPTTNVTSGVGSSANPGMEGLEALVEAATQERRRLSGGTREAEEVVSESANARADINLGMSPVSGRGSPSLRASPVVDRVPFTSSPYPSLGSTFFDARSSPVSEHVDISVEPQLHAEHIHTQDRSSYNSDFPSRSLSRAESTSGDGLVNLPRWTTPPETVSLKSAPDSSHDGQPPPKRRRSSEQPRLTSHSPRLSPTCTPELTPLLSSAAPAETLPEPQLQPIKNRTVAEVPVKSRSQHPLIPEDAPQKSHATSTEDTLDYDTLAHSPPTNAPTPCSPIHDDHARKVLPQNTDARPSGSAEKTRKRPNRELTTTSKSKSEHKLQHTNGHDDDPHEWLLEHYASTTPTVPHSVDSVTPVNHLPSNSRVSPMDEIDDALLHTHGPPPVDSYSTKKKHKEARSRTRTPTPVALLEEELGTNLDRSEGTFKSIADLDLELESELDLVVGKSSERAKDSMDLDVEDELLSLLDDKPRVCRTSRHAPATTTSQSEQLRKFKGAKSTAATELHNVAFDRESMPPPTSIPTSHSNEETSSKNGDDVAPPATNRKDGAQKVSFHSLLSLFFHINAALQTVPKKQLTKAKVKTLPNVRPKTKTSVKASASAKQGSSTPTPSASGSNLNVPTSNGKSKKASPMVNSGVMSAAKRAVSTGGGSRSRSTSVIPAAEVDKKGRASNEAEEQDTAADDRLYCICKTSYDEDRVMIACDR
ncbi:hypothetical protein PHLCEN_2v11713 [Hermanssonia centrifuga]|uniref:Uncharacterized protein n=1 Tax=Hermanssonia centrifuga TaxID=98765 RepID=A0A2R6NJ29_9APHY|nr:hypothetical protein PHLCEN_2v11713 [Hermanssonia centrifuga]